MKQTDIVMPLIRGRYKTKKYTSNYTMKSVVILTDECNEIV